ncbi:MAG: GNAT family N-acetyltransferase [Sporolactobacillus sp.]|jgi:predicted GNAT family acetyltransferase|nr:GNAT family N-acetyltransferase [Sporolactobacillus sp.]
MIRKLTEKDKAAALAFASDRPAENLFIIGDIEAFGMDGEMVTVWGDFDENGKLTGLLLRYGGNFIPYARDENKLDGEAWADLIQETGKLTMLSGLSDRVNRLLPHLGMQVKTRKDCFYATRDVSLPIAREYLRGDVRMLFPEEMDRVIALRTLIPEFTGTASDPDALRENMDKGIARTFYIEKNGEMVSAASTTAETKHAAMIVGVCTKKEYERQGLATACMAKLITVLQKEHKQPCLFYDNPTAGQIYKKLGFHPIGKWTMIGFR